MRCLLHLLLLFSPHARAFDAKKTSRRQRLRDPHLDLVHVDNEREAAKLIGRRPLVEDSRPVWLVGVDDDKQLGFAGRRNEPRPGVIIFTSITRYRMLALAYQLERNPQVRREKVF